MPIFSKAIVALAAVLSPVTIAHGRTLWHQLDRDYSFDQYLLEHGKVYNTEEYHQRKQIFLKNLDVILAHNADSTQTWKRGVNQFTDLTASERRAHRGVDKSLLHWSMHSDAAPPSLKPSVVITADDLDSSAPDALDWRTQKPGTLTAVKNQGSCGSCWTFASAETLESRWFLATGYAEDLSEQFILDCTLNPNQCGGTGGCAGGTAELAYARIKDTNGIPSEWTYPYVSGTGNASTCHGMPLQPEHPHTGVVMAAAKVSGFGRATSNDDAAVMAALQDGPLAISVDAGDWHDYETGVFDGGNMTNPDLDHLVQLIGYGSENGEDYYLVRNSWTPLWGSYGYIKLKRTSQCGIDVTPSDGNGCAGGPSTVKVCGQNGMLYDAVFPVVAD